MQNKHHLQDMLEPVISELGYETVRVITIGQANPTLQIMIDRLDGKDIVVEDCAKVSRKVSEVLDEKDPIKDQYNLEVSSPGLDRPLTKPEHFARFAGYEAKVETDELIENRKRFKGKIISIDGENTIRFEMDGTEYAIPFDAVSKAKIVITDELLQKYVDEHPECGEHIIEE
ncbi:MAG: ribosome maturation factor RimP [Alphaproteobacteria bacterium]|nr:ribosome maturation factor RimP [Alphaproteobacteria bacterium]